MGHEVTVTISGVRGCGKTAIAQIIQEALDHHGITVTQSPSDTAIGHRSPFELGVAIGSLQVQGLTVKIVEQALAKEPTWQP